MVFQRILIALLLAGSSSTGSGMVAAYVSGEHSGWSKEMIALNRAADTKMAGTYRCWSENVGGRGGRCATGTPPLVLNPDGTFSLSSEHGTYKVEGDTIVLSESKLRGAGHLAGGNRIVFEYDYKNLHHTVTYLRQ